MCICLRNLSAGEADISSTDDNEGERSTLVRPGTGLHPSLR